MRGDPRTPWDATRLRRQHTRRRLLAWLTRCPCRHHPYLDHHSRTHHERNQHP